MYKQRLGIFCDLFESFRSQFNTMLNSLLQEVYKKGRDGELSIKIKVSTTREQKFEKGKLCAEWEEPRISWKMERKVNPPKFDVQGRIGEQYVLEFDEVGYPVVYEVNEQMTLFKAAEQVQANRPIIINFNKKDEPEKVEDKQEDPWDDGDVPDGEE